MFLAATALVHLKIKGDGWEQPMTVPADPDELVPAFVAWLDEQGITAPEHSHGIGVGPGSWDGDLSPEDAKRALAWWAKKGIKPA